MYPVYDLNIANQVLKLVLMNVIANKYYESGLPFVFAMVVLICYSPPKSHFHFVTKQIKK